MSRSVSKQRLLARKRRHRRVRKNIFGTPDRPRLCVFRSLHHMYAQIIDDKEGRTLVAVSTLEPGLRDKLADLDKSAQAKAIGKALAERAQTRGIQRVVFDRGGYKYHGRVKALADSAREGGLDF